MNSISRFFARLGGILIAIAATPVSADQLLLVNGDRVSGELLSQTIDTVTIKTSYAGQVKIKRAQVERVITDRPLRITLQDGRQVDGIIQHDDTGLVIKAVDQTAVTVPAGLDGVATIAPIPSDDYDWRGNVTLAAEKQSGNTDTNKLNLDTRVVAEKKGIDRYILTAHSNREQSESKLTAEQYRLGGKYDRFFSKRWYGYLGAGFEQDKFKDLDLRSVYSAGSGYQFYDTDELRLSLEGGLSYTRENLIEDEDNSYAGFSWGLDWEQTFFDNYLNFFHRHRGNQGFDSGDNLIINASTGVRVPIMSGLKAIAQYDLDYDRSPPDDAKSTDHTYSLGVGYDW